MKKNIKKILAICATAIMIFAISIPCCATGWNQWYYSEPVNPTKTDFASAQYQGYYSLATANRLIEIVNTATSVNAFNGDLPIFITMSISATTASAHDNGLSVWCIRASDSDLTILEPLTSANVSTSSSNNVLTCIAQGDGISYRLYEYAITSNGSFVPTGNARNLIMITGYINNPTQAQRLKLVGQWDGQKINNFSHITAFEQYYISYYQGNYAEKTWSAIQTYYENWERVKTEEITPIPPVYSYELNIGEIITAIPNGAKQIINNAFGFEIFGINVAGLLSVLLIVVIVSYAIKWLMNR